MEGPYLTFLGRGLLVWPPFSQQLAARGRGWRNT